MRLDDLIESLQRVRQARGHGEVEVRAAWVESGAPYEGEVEGVELESRSVILRLDEPEYEGD